MKKFTYIALFLLLFTACGRTPEQARKELGKLGVSYNEWSCFESTRKQDELAVELFLDAGMNPECVLAGAALTGDTKLAKKMLEVEADPNRQWANLEAAYTNAWMGAATGNSSTSNAFFEESLSSIYPLAIAASKGHIEIVELLLAVGANPNEGDRISIALFESIQNGHIEIAKLLIQKNAKFEDSVLVSAVNSGDLELANLLTNKGADPNSGLLRAADRNHLEIVRLLLKKGANPDLREEYYGSPLYKAVEADRLEIVKALLEAGASPNTTRTGIDSAKTVLEQAAENGNVEMVKTIVAKGAEINSRSSYGDLESKPLIAAIEEGHTEVVKFLLDKDANPNTEGYYNRSALEMAARSENIAIVRQLLAHKAEVNREKGIYGGTFYSPALEAAYKNENSEIIELLKNAGAVE